MTGHKLKEIMETVLPNLGLQRTVDVTGFEQRKRKRDALKLLRAALVSALSPAGGRQADIMRRYPHADRPTDLALGSAVEAFVSLLRFSPRKFTVELPGSSGGFCSSRSSSWGGSS
jgi:hypothetical protein